NLGIAIAKFVAFLVTGAASMLAESIHSLADTGNQGLLILGGRRARRAPTKEHPFGYGRERYFWAFVVALVLFSGGGLFALFEAEEKLRHPHELESLGWAVGILVVAIVLEGLSLRTAVRESRDEKGDETWRKFVLRSKRAELPVVLLEDSGALIGLGFALAGVVLAAVTGNARFDALGSLGIGILLVVIAMTLATKMKSLLIGEAGSPVQVAAVRAAIAGHGAVARLARLRTLQLSPEELMVVADVEFRDGLDGAGVAAAVDDLGREVQGVVPEARIVHIEPEAPTVRAG
ncbi:MAG TPA: cation diffusion facilitator family transporter, partial [Acidimicrobiales bacterium]